MTVASYAETLPQLVGVAGRTPGYPPEAEAMIEVSTDHCRRVDDANGPTFVLGVYHWITDETLSAIETYSMVVRKNLASGLDTDAVCQSVARDTGIILAEWPRAQAVQQ